MVRLRRIILVSISVLLALTSLSGCGRGGNIRPLNEEETARTAIAEFYAFNRDDRLEKFDEETNAALEEAHKENPNAQVVTIDSSEIFRKYYEELCILTEDGLTDYFLNNRLPQKFERAALDQGLDVEIDEVTFHQFTREGEKTKYYYDAKLIMKAKNGSDGDGTTYIATGRADVVKGEEQPYKVIELVVTTIQDYDGNSWPGF